MLVDSLADGLLTELLQMSKGVSSADERGEEMREYDRVGQFFHGAVFSFLSVYDPCHKQLEVVWMQVLYLVR